MLYYFYEFIKALIYHPLDLVWNIKQLYNIRRLDKISKINNEVMCINDMNIMCNTPHHKSLKCEYAGCSNSHLGLIVQYFDNAKCCIDVAVYALNSAPISRALRRAHNRGIAVRIITEKCFTRSDGKSDDLHVVPLVQPRPRSDRMMHHKFCIIDGYRRVREIRKQDDHRPGTALLMTGSFNWIAFQQSYDDLLITSNVTLALKMEQEFCRIWKLIKMGKI